MDAKSSSPWGVSTMAAAPSAASTVCWLMPEIKKTAFAAGADQANRGITLSLISSSDELI